MERPEHSPRRSRPYLWIVCGTVALCMGCDSPTAPLVPALTGRFVGPTGVDTYQYFDLQTRGTKVTGALVSGGVVGVGSSYKVSGAAVLPQVTLTWSQPNGYHIRFDATLSANTDTLSGEVSYTSSTGNGQYFSRFRRTTTP
jgi:hypothetical protein